MTSQKLHALLNSRVFAYILVPVLCLFFVFFVFYDQLSETSFWSVVAFFYILTLVKVVLEWTLILKKDDSGGIWLNQKVPYGKLIGMSIAPVLLIFSFDTFGLQIPIALLLLISTQLVLFTLLYPQMISPLCVL